MYSEDDLNLAIAKKIFTETAVNKFRQEISKAKNSPSVDEENFRLIGGYNDIFVVIACCLLLFSSIFVLSPINESLALLSFVTISWVLAEFFVLKRKMSLPAIVLLITFVGGMYYLCISFFTNTSEITIIIATASTTVAAYMHWLRFKVPITVAAGTIALISLLASVVLSIFPDAKDWIQLLVAICGIGSFFLAMYWDSSDISRTTRKSDVAFWLHLISAPLIIHPLFSILGVFEESQSIMSMGSVIALYIVMSFISIAIDRRALMVSSLAYVLYALTTILKDYGNIEYSFAITGVFMGTTLLLLSAFWHSTRQYVVNWLPLKTRKYLPNVAFVMDKNLKLIALDYLYYHDDKITNQIDAIEEQNLNQLVLGENPKYEWFDCIPEIEKQLLEINITDKQFEKIICLSAECCVTHHLIMPNWDGEGDQFSIKSFSGVEKMLNLKVLEFIDFTFAKDIKKLFKLDIEKINEYYGLNDAHKKVFIDMGVKIS